MKTLIGMIFACMFMALGGITLSVSASDATPELTYIIEEGSKYYESSFAFGSGRTAIVAKDNPYTSKPCYAGINGYSFLDQYGNVIMCDYNESTNNITIPEPPKTAVKLFVHFRTEKYRNGWINSEDVINPKDIELTGKDDKRLELPEEQKPKEIVENISNEIKQSKDKRTSIVIDFSGSMSDNQKEVVDLLGTLDELDSDNTQIIVFADEYEVVTKQQLIDEDFYVGGGTQMLPALNEAIDIGTEKIIIISDLETYDLHTDITLKQSKVLEWVIIYDPDDSSRDDRVENVLKDTWENANIRRIKIKD